MARFLVKNVHQKTCVMMKLDYVLILRSIINKFGRAYIATQRKRRKRKLYIHTHTTLSTQFIPLVQNHKHLCGDPPTKIMLQYSLIIYSSQCVPLMVY